MPADEELSLSLAEWLVLSLVCEEPRHGFAIARILGREGSMGRIWRVPKPVIYRALQRLRAPRVGPTPGAPPAHRGPGPAPRGSPPARPAPAPRHAHRLGDRPVPRRAVRAGHGPVEPGRSGAFPYRSGLLPLVPSRLLLSH